jgi:hypothetical protein
MIDRFDTHHTTRYDLILVHSFVSLLEMNPVKICYTFHDSSSNVQSLGGHWRMWYIDWIWPDEILSWSLSPHFIKLYLQHPIPLFSLSRHCHCFKRSGPFATELDGCLIVLGITDLMKLGLDLRYFLLLHVHIVGV